MLWKQAQKRISSVTIQLGMGSRNRPARRAGGTISRRCIICFAFTRRRQPLIQHSESAQLKAIGTLVAEMFDCCTVLSRASVGSGGRYQHSDSAGGVRRALAGSGGRYQHWNAAGGPTETSSGKNTNTLSVSDKKAVNTNPLRHITPFYPVATRPLLSVVPSPPRRCVSGQDSRKDSVSVRFDKSHT